MKYKILRRYWDININPKVMASGINLKEAKKRCIMTKDYFDLVSKIEY
jgi:hypothetical protein